MAHRIARDREGRLVFCLESSEGFPAQDLVRKKLGAEKLRFIPADLLHLHEGEEEMIVAVRSGTDSARNASRRFGIRPPSLPAGGYRIECIDGGLIVAGGDLFGMLAGLSDVLVNSERSRSALVFCGQSRTERPAFPLRALWTWDHSANWTCDPGNQGYGAGNSYLKRPETFLEDYRTLIDHCVDTRFNAVIIWGFLRDAHGGEQYASEVARYAADRGVAVLPGVGVTGYGGVYYVGNHPANLETFLRHHPKLGNTRPDGSIDCHNSSPFHPETQEWIRDTLRWLYTTMPVGGCNLENMDLLVDHSALARKTRAVIRSGEADFLKDQFFAYRAALAEAHRLAPTRWNTFATYCGFSPRQSSDGGRGNPRPEDNVLDANTSLRPYFTTHLPQSAIAQWTISTMLRKEPVPMRQWLESATPEAVYNNTRWPKQLSAPMARSAGFMHHACWFSEFRRNDLALSSVAEAGLRCSESGLEGLVCMGETSRRTLVAELNYLAMRRWSYHPKSTLVEFAESELAPRVGGKADAIRFAESLCSLEEAKMEPVRACVGRFRRKPKHYPNRFRAGVTTETTAPYRRWMELLEWTYSATKPKGRIQGFTDMM